MLKLDDLMVGNKMYSNNYKGFVYFLKFRLMVSLLLCFIEKFKFGNLCV